MSDEERLPARPAERSEAEVHLRRLFALSLDLLCVAGFDGYFKRVNPAFERVLGYGADVLLSRQFIDFVHPDDRESTLGEVERLAAGGVTVDFENRYRTAGGEYRWLAWRAAPMIDRGLIYAVARDVTQKKADRRLLDEQAAELARSNADLEQFARVASHDLRAPLRSIVTLAGFLEEDLGDAIADQSREHLAELRRRALLLQALTEDLLVYSQAGDEREDVVEVDCAELVAEVAFVLDPPDTFRIVADDSLPRLETARGPLAQVLRNLIANAVKHRDHDDGEVRVSARDAGEWWEFAVTDDGPGIAAEDHERACRVFAEGQPDAADPDSWGMGLALVERVVGRFGGRVRLDPRGETERETERRSDPEANRGRTQGRGATFRFDWPKRIDPES